MWEAHLTAAPTQAQRTLCERYVHGEHPGDHNHQDIPKSIAIQMRGVLRYKWEACCDTNGQSTEIFPFVESSVAPKALQYKLQAYYNTN